MPNDAAPLYAKTIASPVGDLRLVASDAGVVAILWAPDRPSRVAVGGASEAPDHPVLLKAQWQLEDYFAGRRRTFDLPLDFRGTAFQKRVWAELLRIPYGETRSYKEIATCLGDPNATRAVGAANGRNPIPIVAPCHRVIGASGALTGFGGGLDTKRFLLGLEAPAGLFGRAAERGAAPV